MTWLWLPLLMLAALWLWPPAFSKATNGRVEGWLSISRLEMWPLEEATLRVTVINRSWMPLPLVAIEIRLPEELSFRPDAPIRRGRAALAVLPRRQADVDFTVYGWRRGAVTSIQGHIALREGLGLVEIFLPLQVRASLGVRPKRRRMARSLEASLEGAMVRESRLFPDETALRGVRRYAYGDPVRHIHWRATARLGTLMVKEFFSTEMPRWAVVLNAQSARPHWMAAVDAETFDALCEEALAAAEWLTRRGEPVCFATNAACGHRERSVIRWLNAQGVASLLAHAKPIATCDLGTLITALARSHRALDHWVILTPWDDPEAASRLDRLGIRAFWICPNSPSEGERREETEGTPHAATGR
ncbi:DUF58 domain-containing protein [Alicyclobacillus fructus]|uniref:DUF58 domain-containing protein n=1 Tax=Alicyclobacillus fructus TaxID=2816082 RepID=UPI001A8FD8C7|nr:DUF58 domain-containing protein [Alicyclobacillus fructus]